MSPSGCGLTHTPVRVVKQELCSVVDCIAKLKKTITSNNRLSGVGRSNKRNHVIFFCASMASPRGTPTKKARVEARNIAYCVSLMRVHCADIARALGLRRAAG
eukprot:scaffold7541_cov116-Isochrysis_galbana.AAC.2